MVKRCMYEIIVNHVIVSCLSRKIYCVPTELGKAHDSLQLEIYLCTLSVQYAQLIIWRFNSIKIVFM